MPHIYLVFFYVKKIQLNKKKFFGPKVKISKNIKFFKMFQKIFKCPLSIPHSPHMICIKYEDFSEEGREVVNDVMI